MTLFFGGILIPPISTLIVRRVLRRGAPAPGNPGGLTVLETVIPSCAIAVGAHDFGFRSAYGDNAHWFIASALCAAGIGSIFAKFPDAAALPYTVSAMELAFGCWFTWRGLSRDERTSDQP